MRVRDSLQMVAKVVELEALVPLMIPQRANTRGADLSGLNVPFRMWQSAQAGRAAASVKVKVIVSGVCLSPFISSAKRRKRNGAVNARRP